MSCVSTVKTARAGKVKFALLAARRAASPELPAKVSCLSCLVFFVGVPWEAKRGRVAFLERTRVCTVPCEELIPKPAG